MHLFSRGQGFKAWANEKEPAVLFDETDISAREMTAVFFQIKSLSSQFD